MKSKICSLPEYVKHENLAKLDLENDLVKLGKYIHSSNMGLFNTLVGDPFFVGKEDNYGGLVVNLMEMEHTAQEFESKLNLSLTAWKVQISSEIEVYIMRRISDYGSVGENGLFMPELGVAEKIHTLTFTIWQNISLIKNLKSMLELKGSQNEHKVLGLTL
ncbi:hypothetical protein YC2023_039636 [Brassica napus]